MEARRRGQGVPDVYVFRRPDSPLVALDAADRGDIEAQWRRLTDFFEKWFRSRSGEFLAAFQEFETTDEFAAKVEDCLRQWLARRGFVAKGMAWDRAQLGSPFPGLAAFDENRQSVFFGRTVFVDQAIRRLRELEAPAAEASRASFLLLIGASGSGKSSLLRAGLAPRIVMPGVFPEVDLWRRAVISADADPFAALAAALLKSDALGPELADGPFGAAGLLAKQLGGDPDAAVAPLKDALARAAAKRAREANFETPRAARLFLGLDQAERLISETPPEVAARFAALIATLARLRLATVVVALRSDAYAGFQALAPLVALRDAGASLDLLAPNASELEEMTTGPVALCDPPLAFERRDGRSLAADLVADARGGDALPLLQMTLSRLAAAEATRGDGLLRFADYRGMGAAVTETADEALAGLDPARANNCRTSSPVWCATSPPIRSPARRRRVIGALDLGAFEAGRPERRALVEAFVAKRLLTAEGDAASQRVRPTHEALLRIWPEATAIIAEAAQLLRVRHALAPLARDWTEAADADKPRHLDISPAMLDGAATLCRALRRRGVADDARLRRRSERRRRGAPRPRTRGAAPSRRRRRGDRRRHGSASPNAPASVSSSRSCSLGLAGWQWYSADLARTDAQTQRDRAERALAARDQDRRRAGVRSRAEIPQRRGRAEGSRQGHPRSGARASGAIADVGRVERQADRQPRRRARRARNHRAFARRPADCAQARPAGARDLREDPRRRAQRRTLHSRHRLYRRIDRRHSGATGRLRGRASRLRQRASADRCSASARLQERAAAHRQGALSPGPRRARAHARRLRRGAEVVPRRIDDGAIDRRRIAQGNGRAARPGGRPPQRRRRLARSAGDGLPPQRRVRRRQRDRQEPRPAISRKHPASARLYAEPGAAWRDADREKRPRRRVESLSARARRPRSRSPPATTAISNGNTISPSVTSKSATPSRPSAITPRRGSRSAPRSRSTA